MNEGEVVSITVELSSRPASTATFSFGGIDGVITAEPTSLTFTTTDWDEPQTVRLTFLEDDDAVDIPLLRVGGYLEIAGVRRFLRSILLVRITDNDKNAPALRFDPQSVTVGEGGSGTYRVRLSSQPTDAVTVAITGQSGTDLMLDNTSLTFTTGDWETDQTVTVSARQDDDGDDDVVTLTHAASGGGYTNVRGNVLVTVTDDDGDKPTVSITGVPAKINSTTALSVAFTFSEAVTGFVTGDVTVTGGTKGAFSGSGTTYTLAVTPSGSADVVVTVAADAATDGGGNTGPAFAVSATAEWDATAPTVSITGVPAKITSRTPFTATFTFSEDVTGFAAGDVTVTGGGTGTLTAVSETTYRLAVTPAGSAHVVVTVAADAATDGVNTGPVSAVTATATWDAPGLRFDPQSLAVGEGDSGTYRVRLLKQPTDAVTVAITGQSGTDLMLDNTSLMFTRMNWETEQTVTVTAGQDDDGDDDVVRLLHTASGGDYTNVIGAVFVTVTDDDGDKPTVSITGVPAKINSTAALSVAFTFSEAVTGFVTGDVTVAGGTKGAFSGSGRDYTLAVTPTSGSNVTVEVAADAATDGDGNTGPASAATATATWDAAAPTVTIGGVPAKINSTTALSVTFDFSEAVTGFVTGDVTVAGGTKGAFSGSGRSYTLAVTPTSGSNVTVTVAADAATDGLNTGPASAVTATATWDAAAPTVEIGGVPAKINSTAALSVTFDFSEDVTGFVTGDVTVTGGTKGAFSGSGREYTLAVTPTSGSNVTVEVAANSATDGLNTGPASAVSATAVWDAAAPEVSFASSSSSAGEDAGTRNVTVSLSPAPTAAITVNYTVGGTATAGSDFSIGGSGTLSVASGAATAAIPVAITDDAADEDNETVVLTLTTGGGYTVGSRNSHTLTIVDDDGTTPAVSLSAAPNPVDEGGPVTVTARLSEALSGGVTVPLVLTAGTAEAGDYGSLASIAIGGGQTTGTGTVTTARDADRDDETFTVALGALPEGLSPGSPSSVVVTIRDRTPPPNRPPTVTASCAPCVVGPGGTARLTATASDPDGDPLTYGWSAARGAFSGPVDEPAATWTAPDGLGRFEILVEVSDGRGGTASASVEVHAVNEGPEFGQRSYRFLLPENLDGRQRPVELGTVTAEDPDGDDLRYGIVFGDSERFTVGLRDGVVRYTGPGEDFETEPNLFELTVRARDAFGSEARARVVVTVTDVNELPEVTASCDPCTVPRGGEVWLEARATDPDGDPLAYGWSAAKGTFNGSVNASWAVWKAPDELGTMAIRVEVSDGRGGTASAVVEVEVVNRAPAFESPSYFFLVPENVDGRERPADLDRVAALDPDGDALSYEIVSGDRQRFAVGALDGTVRYIGPGEDFETPPNRFELVVRALDGFGGEARTEVAVEVTDVNEAPEAADDEVVTPEDRAVTVDVLANDTDPEGDRLHVRSVTAAAHGAVRLVSGGVVIYTPERDFHGADSFTYVASDGRGLRDTATVAVTVLPVNDAPTAIGRVPDQTLDEGGAPVQVDLSPYFGDVDGDALTYGARSNDTGVVEAAVAGTVLVLTPVVYGSATVTVTAWDPAGLTANQSVRVGVSDRPQRAVLGNVLAATARGHLASLRAALGRRMQAPPCEASRLAVMGRSVPLGRTGAADMLRGTWTGARSAAAAALGMGEGSGDPFAMRLQAERGAPTALAANAVPETAARMEAALRSVPARALGVAGGGSGAGAADFLLGWGGSEQDGGRCRGRGRWSLWGQGDIQRFEGTPSADSGYDGELSTAYAGLDTRLGARWLAGVAVSRSKGVGDWRAGTSEGRLTQFMTAVHPYLRWDGRSTSIWASAGAGRGNARNARAAGRTGASPTTLRLGLVELEQRAGAPGGLDFAFLGDAAWARLRTGDGDETIDRQDIEVNQMRIGFDLSMPVRLGGLELTPSGTVHARFDGGAGQTGDGVEVAGELRAVLGIVRLDAQARMLVHHTAEGYGERGAAVTLALGGQGGEEGFSLSVSPRWGGPASASGALLHGPLGGGFRSGGPDPEGWNLDARASYGVNLPGGLRLDLHGSYGAAGGGPGFGLSVGKPASAAVKSEG